MSKFRTKHFLTHFVGILSQQNTMNVGVYFLFLVSDKSSKWRVLEEGQCA